MVLSGTIGMNLSDTEACTEPALCPAERECIPILIRAIVHTWVHTWGGLPQVLLEDLRTYRFVLSA